MSKYIFNILIISSTFVFILGVIGLILNRHNLLVILMSIELMLLGVNLNFIIFSIYLDDFLGQVFSLYVLTVAAAESAIGLAIFSVYYRNKQGFSLMSGIRARR
jgi:NADH-quinone oxidoreductase subunit K